jgi:hypothetical protein
MLASHARPFLLTLNWWTGVPGGEPISLYVPDEQVCASGTRSVAVDHATAGRVHRAHGLAELDLAAAAVPGRDASVQRGANDPRPRRRMPADLPPGSPRAGECLIDQVFGPVQVTDAGQHGAQAIIP